MDEKVRTLKNRFVRINEPVIKHVLENFCGGNTEFAIDCLRSLSSFQIEEIEKNLAITSSSETTLSPVEKEKCQQFQNLTNTDESFAAECLKKAQWVVEHAINRFYNSGAVVTKPSDSKKPIEQEKKLPPLRMNYEGLYDIKSRQFLVLETVKYDIKISDYAVEKTCIRNFINRKEEALEVVFVYPMVEESSSVFSVEVEIINLETKEKSSHFAEIKGNRESSEEYDEKISQGDLVVLLEKREKQKQLAQIILGNLLPNHEVVVMVRSVEEMDIIDYDENLMFEEEEEEEEGEEDDDDEEEGEDGESSDIPKKKVEQKMMMRLRIPSIFPIIEDGDEIDEVEQTVKTALAIPNVSVICDVNLSAGEIVNVITQGVVIRKEVIGISRWFISTKKEIAMTKDFVLDILVKSFPTATCLIQKIPEGIIENVEGVGMISFIPKNKVEIKEDQEIYSEFVIIVDCSGSMSGSRIRFAKEAMRCFVQSLDPNDKVKLNIVRFGSYYQTLWKQPYELTEKNFNEVLDYINNTKANLAQTDILTPLLKVLKTEVTTSFSRQIFLLTDGEDKKTLRITQAVRKESNSTRIFTLGIGNEINVFLIKEMSRASNGKYGFLKKSEEIRKKVMEQLLFAVQPSVSDVECKWPDDDDNSKFGKIELIGEGRSKWVYLNERQILYFFFEKLPLNNNNLEEEIEEEEEKKKSNNNEVTINYIFGTTQTRFSVNIPIIIVPPTSNDVPPLLIGRLAAMKKINDLQKYGGKDKQKDLESIKKLGLGFSLLTSETSFILSSRRQQQQEAIDYNLELINIPTIPYIDQLPERPKIHIPRDIHGHRRNREAYTGVGGSRRSLYTNHGISAYNNAVMTTTDISSGHYRMASDGKGLGVGLDFKKHVDEVKKES